MAASVPVPMAMPRSACGEGGGVVHAVADHGDPVALGLQPPDDVDLALGPDVGHDLVDADLGGDRRRPSGRCRRSAARAAARGARQPRRRRRRRSPSRCRRPRPARGPAPPSRRARRCGPGPARPRTPRPASGRPRSPSVGEQVGRGRPRRVRHPRPRRPHPARAGSRSAVTRGNEPARPACVVRACATGCSDDPASAAPASRTSSASSTPVAGTTSTTRIRPSVTVPVLSSRTVSTSRVASRTSGPLMTMPSCAPRPVPTSSAVGVARPSAQGQAMTSTATAAVTAYDASAPASSQPISVTSGEHEDDGHEHARDPVGEPLHRRPCRSAPR